MEAFSAADGAVLILLIRIPPVAATFWDFGIWVRILAS